MAYYMGKDIEKSRGNAMQEVILEKRSIAQVARRFDKNRSTLYRQMKKWKMQSMDARKDIQASCGLGNSKKRKPRTA